MSKKGHAYGIKEENVGSTSINIDTKLLKKKKNQILTI